MSKVRILIVEDEMIIANDMKFMLESVGYEVSAIARSLEKAIPVLEEGKTDLVLIDINLGKGTEGIELGRMMREKYHLPFIFCTSYSDQRTVMEAGKVHPNGYLLKPFNREDLYVAIEIALVNYSGDNELQADESILQDCLFIKEGHLFTKVLFDDIVYVEQDRNYVEVHTSQRVHPVRSTLKDFIKQLPQKKFFQVHRSFVVNVSCIHSINSDMIKVSGKEIPISKAHRETLLGMIRLLS